MDRMIKGYCGSLYGNFRQKKYSDVYDSVESFLADYQNIGLPVTISDDNASVLYYLLYSKFGNDILAPSDINRFKYRLFAIVWQYGPNWEKEIDIQKKLRDMTEADLMDGSRQIYNNAQNPGTEPGTNTSEELAYIDNQNVTKNKRSRLEAYALLDTLLKKDVTEEFLSRFKPLFLAVVEPEAPLYYISEDEEDG